MTTNFKILYDEKDARAWSEYITFSIKFNCKLFWYSKLLLLYVPR